MKTKKNKPVVRGGSQKPAKRSQDNKKPTRAQLQAAYQNGYLAGIEAANGYQGRHFESAHARLGLSHGYRDGRKVIKIKNRVDNYRAYRKKG